MRRALHQHGITGEGLVGSAHSVEERAELYRLLLEETGGQPRDFSMLLRLKSLLDLDFEQAEELELQVEASLAQKQQLSTGQQEQQGAWSEVLPLPTLVRRPAASGATQ